MSRFLSAITGNGSSNGHSKAGSSASSVHSVDSKAPSPPSKDSVTDRPPPEIVVATKPRNEAEAKALEAFRERLESAKLYEREKDGKEASHPDITLLRYLRARKMNLDGAFNQFSATEKWRAQYGANEIMDHFDIEQVARLKDVYPQWTGRMDRLNIPLYVSQFRRLTSDRMKEISTLTEEERYKLELQLHEEQLRLHCPYAGPGVVSSTTIADIGDTSIADFWRLRKHLQYSTSMSNAHYPETLGIIMIVNAPFYFTKVWSFIQGWLDEGTQGKVHVLAKGESLERWIDPVNIPKCYGGQLDWEPGQEPAFDPARGECSGWYGSTIERSKLGMNGDMPVGNAHSNRVKVAKARGGPTGRGVERATDATKTEVEVQPANGVAEVPAAEVVSSPKQEQEHAASANVTAANGTTTEAPVVAEATQ